MSTEHKNYYPLRVDKKYGSAIVSDVDPCRPTYDSNSKQYELNEYGGHIIAESLPPGVAQQLVDAYNEKYAQQSFTPRESSTIQDQIEWITDRKIIVDKKELHIVDAIIENLIAIKRWNQNPLWSQLDIEKVIGDLVDFIKIFEQTGSWSNIDKSNAIQNAEAALGMLQAFREKRDTNSLTYKNFEKLSKMARDENRIKIIIDNLAKSFGGERNYDIKRTAAEHVVKAIDEMIKLRANG